MPHAIPKIYYAVVTPTGTTTNLSDTITGLSSLTGITIGMYVEGAGIPANTQVIAVGVNVQLNKQATANGSVTLTFFNRVVFDYPPIETSGETIDPKERQSTSISGRVQTSIDFVEGKRSLNFSFLSQDIYDALKLFHTSHAYIGRTFRYYDDQTLGTYLEYELSDLRFEGKKIAPKGSGYIWTVPLRFRRVL